MSIQATILYVLAAALFALAVWMLAKYQRQPAIWYYVLFLIGLSGIAVAQGGVFSAETPETALSITRWGYVAGSLTFSALLVFSLYFPIPSARSPKQPLLFVLLPVLFFGTLALTSTMFLKGVSIEDAGSIEEYGKLFWLFPAFVFLYVIWAIRNLSEKLSVSQGIQARSIRVFLLTLIVASLAGFIFDVLLPALGQARIPVGIYTSSVLFGLSAYIVTRK